MDPATQSRARLTLHAIERHSELLVAALDDAVVELSPECIRWSAVSDPRRWLTTSVGTHGGERDKLRAQALSLAPAFVTAAQELEQFITGGAAGHECDSKAQLRDDVVSTARTLASALRAWIESHPGVESGPTASELFPQYVHRTVPRGGEPFPEAGMDPLFPRQ